MTEINFEFSVKYRTALYRRLVEAVEEHASTVEFAKFFVLQLNKAFEVHAGIVFIVEGDLLRNEQIEICAEAVKFIQHEIEAGRDMINRVLYISINGTKQLETLP